MKIWVITATWNCKETVADCLASVAAQTHPEREHIVIDGSSDDGTLGVLENHRDKIKVLLSEQDQGIYDALNKGIEQANGDVVGFLHADDLYANSDVLASIAAAFADSKVDAVYGDLVYVEKNDTARVIRYWRAGEYRPARLRWGWMPPHPTFYVRRKMYERYGGFDLALGSAADYELMLRFLLKHRINTAYIPEVLVKMRIGGTSNASLKSRLLANRMDRKAWQVNDLKPYPWTLALKPIRKIPQYFLKKKI